MGEYLAAFKAYDVRGVVPTELNPEIAYKIARAYADEIGGTRVCVGYDIRLSGPDICEAITRGLNDAGVDVIQLGLVGTEMVYFATAFYGYDGGMMITASHNPPEFNGIKMVRNESRPISGDTGLLAIEKRAYDEKFERTGSGHVLQLDCYDEFIAHLRRLVDPATIKPLKVLCDVGNGAAGVALEKLLPHLSLQVTRRHFEPDGKFPNGVPNPILVESRAGTVEAMQNETFDFGVAWDGDYDRCFFFDGTGHFIEGYYIVGLLAQAILKLHPGAGIIHDPRLVWNTEAIIKANGGRAVECKSGHAFIKEKMRKTDCIYGGEMSAHHYFKDHWYCDSGMIPFLLVAQLVSQSGQSLHELVSAMEAHYPTEGELNSKVSSLAEVEEITQRLKELYADGKQEFIDGVSVEYPHWRFNVRGSNTEAVIRLCLETDGDAELMKSKTEEVLGVIRSGNSSL